MTQHKSKPLDQIIQQAKNNDPLVVEALTQEYYSYLLWLAISILHDRQEAEDAAQDSLIQAVTHLPSFRGDANLKTWLYTICVNTCRTQLRKRKRRTRLQNSLQTLHFTKPKVTPSSENALLKSESDTELWQTVDTLSEKHRMPVILRYVHELSIAEIAEILNLNEGTVNSRLHYARKRLKEKLSREQARPSHLPEKPR